MKAGIARSRPHRTVPGMDPHTCQDETLARHRDVGSIAHRVIATLAAQTRTPDVPAILRAVDRALPQLEPNEGRAHKQNIAGSVNTYFNRLLPPAGWDFHGAEVHLGRGRIDLLWQNPAGRLLIDEVKTGHAAFFASTDNLSQALRYVHHARQLYGARLAGLRLLCLSHPGQSLFLHHPHAAPIPLTNTRHI